MFAQAALAIAQKKLDDAAAEHGRPDVIHNDKLAPAHKTEHHQDCHTLYVETSKWIRDAKASDIHDAMMVHLKPLPADSAAHRKTLEVLLASIWHARGPRDDMGEREVFLKAISIALDDPEFRPAVLEALPTAGPEYGCWRDMVDLWLRRPLDVELRTLLVDTMASALERNNSLVAKWSPRWESKTKKRPSHRAGKLRDLVRAISVRLFPDAPDALARYRKLCSKINRDSQCPETLMVAGKWELLASRATKLPSRYLALWKNVLANRTKDGKGERSADPERRRAAKVYGDVILSAKQGKVKLHGTQDALGVMSAAYLKSKSNFGYNSKIPESLLEDAETELQLSSMLDDLIENGLPSVVPICDTSGSMYCPSGMPGVFCYDAAVMMSVVTLMAEGRAGRPQYVISFAEHPQIFDCTPPKGKEKSWLWMLRHVYNCHTHWGGTTNFEACMGLVLKMLVDNAIPTDQMPEMVCYSDMQFDAAQGAGCYRSIVQAKPFETLTEVLDRRFQAAGYPRAPSLLYWNLAAGKRGQPVDPDKAGAIIMGGFSPQALKGFFSGDTARMGSMTPLDAAREAVAHPRFDLLREAVARLVF